MRHRKSGRKLKRTASHRKALLSALSTSLLRHRKIRTTTAKAKEAQRFVEALISKAKRALAHDSKDKGKAVHARRAVSRYIKDRAVVKSLFEEIAPKVMERPGGYTRVVKLGQRHGDAADVAVLELVDFSGAGTPAPSAKEAKSAKGKPKKKEASKKEASEEKKETKRKAAGAKPK